MSSTEYSIFKDILIVIFTRIEDEEPFELYSLVM